MIASALPSVGRLLGLDLGGRRIGVAISDDRQSLASPYATVVRSGRELDELRDIAERLEARGVVCGLPTSLSGQEGPQAREVRADAENIAARLDLPLAFWDERLSTAAAERQLIASGQSSERRKARLDAVAAAIILQGFLDRRSHIASSHGTDD